MAEKQLKSVKFKPYSGIHPSCTVTADEILEWVEPPKGIDPERFKGYLEVTLQGLFLRGQLYQWESD